MTTRTFNPTEMYQSQIPALQLLVALGFRPLSQSEALRLRGRRLRNVVLEDVLADQLMRINKFAHRGQEYTFDLTDVHEAMRRLQRSPDQQRGLEGTNQDIYDTLILGTTITKVIGGDTRSYSFRYVDWDNPENNVFHVTPEFSVGCASSRQTRRCDIVAFVNGIPFLVIENKRRSKGIRPAESQLIGYQKKDNIPQLFHYAQVLMSMSGGEARYATVGTPRKFWQAWTEGEDRDSDIATLTKREFTTEEMDAMFSGSFASARSYFETMTVKEGRSITEQDRMVYSLCRPERLLDVVRRFTVFNRGERKVARHQQFFAVKRALELMQKENSDGARKGGVIWHTQGSGKSLTMVMLGRALAMERDIRNPRIIIVTDRDELDRQIEDTFRSCDLEPVRANSGVHLLELVRSKVPLITTIVNKFDAALKNDQFKDDDPNIFVLVDESHRTQTGPFGGHGHFAVRMRRLLPRACFLGFTGTPLLKKEKNTLRDFGELIHRYTIEEAVREGTVVPLLYEGRFVEQKVDGEVIDEWFEKLSWELTESQEADLKRRFSRIGALAKTKQAIFAKASDISGHYRRHWQGTGFKAQIVAPSKAAAVQFKEFLDEFGNVSSEVIISSPDENEDNEVVDQEPNDRVRRFWSEMMDRYGSEEAYNREIISGFKGAGDPEILIVVSKLLTGFDVPRNTILYICKQLREHSLLQAIARVNRLHEEEGKDKEFGYIIDYEGLLGKLDEALTTYGALDGYDAADIKGAVRDVRKVIGELPRHRRALLEVFKGIRNQQDMEEFETYLADESRRHDFYTKLQTFSRYLHTALASVELYEVLDEVEIDAMKTEWNQFTELRRSVQLRYQEIVDIREFEPKIQRLLDDHVSAKPAKTIIKPLDINDPDALKAVVYDEDLVPASRADRIASATRKSIVEKMAEDPVIYQQFSELLERTIRDYREQRLHEREYLKSVVDLASQVARRKHDRGVPASVRGNADAAAFFRIFDGKLHLTDGQAVDSDKAAFIAMKLMEIVKERLIVGIWFNEVAQNELRDAIDDYLYDTVCGQEGIDLSDELLDTLAASILNLAEARFPS